jgi:hypothetical protein
VQSYRSCNRLRVVSRFGEEEFSKDAGADRCAPLKSGWHRASVFATGPKDTTIAVTITAAVCMTCRESHAEPQDEP